MKLFIKKIKINAWTSTTFIMMVVTGVLIGFFWQRIPPEFPWFYSLPWGEDQLMPKFNIVYIFLISQVVLVITNFLPRWVKESDIVVERTVGISVFFIHLLLVINITRVLTIFI